MEAPLKAAGEAIAVEMDKSNKTMTTWYQKHVGQATTDAEQRRAMQEFDILLEKESRIVGRMGDFEIGVHWEVPKGEKGVTTRLVLRLNKDGVTWSDNTEVTLLIAGIVKERTTKDGKPNYVPLAQYLRDMPGRIRQTLKWEVGQLNDMEKELTYSKTLIGQPWPKEADYQKALTRKTELERIVQGINNDRGATTEKVAGESMLKSMGQLQPRRSPEV